MDIYNTSTVNKFLHVYIVSLPISLWHQILELILYCILESMYICMHSEKNLSIYVLSQKKSPVPITYWFTIVTGRELFSLIVHRMCIFLMNIPYVEQHVKLKCQIPHRLHIKYIRILSLKPWLESFLYRKYQQ